MLPRLAIALLVLTLATGFAAASIDAASPMDAPSDVKGAQPADSAEPAIPATTQWGMSIMVLLVLSASTLMFMKDQLLERAAAWGRSGGSERVSVEAATVSEESRPTRKAVSSPKNKTKREFSTKRQGNERARKDWNLTRKGAPQAGGRRRGGPGCRGVR